MFRYFINKTRRRWSFVQPRLVIITPAGITQVERRAVRDAAQQAGAREVYLVQASMAAALGAGLPVEQPGASMIVDVGGGTTEVAVMSLCGIVYSESLRIAGDEMNQAIIHYLRRAYDLLVGERRAEDAKIRLGSAYPKGDDQEPIEVQGRDLLDGLPKTVVITALEVREALREPVAASSPRCAPASSTPRPSWPPTSAASGSCPRVAARSCGDWTPSCTRRPGSASA